MFLEIWFRKMSDYAQRVLREGRIEERDGRQFFVHPGLCCPSVPDDGEKDDGEAAQTSEFLTRMLSCEADSTRTVRAFLDLDRRMRRGQIACGREHLRAVRNSLERANAFRARVRKAIAGMRAHGHVIF